jgi:hypothetical protein
MQVEEVSAAVFEDGVGAAVVHLLRLAHEHDCLRLQLLVVRRQSSVLTAIAGEPVARRDAWSATRSR